jgi:hypothetical protein
MNTCGKRAKIRLIIAKSVDATGFSGLMDAKGKASTMHPQ